MMDQKAVDSAVPVSERMQENKGPSDGGGNHHWRRFRFQSETGGPQPARHECVDFLGARGNEMDAFKIRRTGSG